MKNKSRISIIAELGVNHNGDFETAKKLIEVAAQSGADYAKFQTFNVDELVTRRSIKADYQIDKKDGQIYQHQMLKNLSLSRDDHYSLQAYSESKGISFLSTAFDVDSVDFLASMGLQVFKIPSGEITNLVLLRHIGQYGCAVFLSTGMAELKEIKEALDILELSGTSRNNITTLHCTTAYPAPISEVNLNAMHTIAQELNVAIGYSDHTLGIEIPIAAAALGATVIEKHLTLDRDLQGPDHKASLEPDEFAEMVNAIRNIENAMGDGVKSPTDSELKNRSNVRRSIVAKYKIARGVKFTAENLAVKRPGNGISPMRWDDVLGRLAIRDYESDEMIEI